MTGVPRSRPAKQPNWRPGDRREVHPMRRWLVRFAWTFGAIALIVAFVLLLNWTADGEKVAFVPLTVENYDPGELPPPAFANSDRAGLAILPWSDTSTPKLANPLQAAKTLRNWNAPPELDTLICYISSHVAVRPYGEKEYRVCLIAPDFRRAELADFLVPGDNGAAVDVRELLQAMKQVPAKSKLLLVDSPRAHAEPWLAALGRNWTETLAADVDATDDHALWVIVPGESDAVSRINHQAHGSQFSKAIADAFTTIDGGGGPVDLSTFVARLTQVTGQPPLVLHVGQGDGNPQFLQVALPRQEPATNTETTAAPAPEKEASTAPAKDGPDAKKAPPDPVLLAWQASDDLLDVEQNQSTIGPNDYAPDLWRKLQSIMVWHDWAAHTGWTPPKDDASHDPFADLIVAKPMLALAPNPTGGDPNHPAITPLVDAANRFSADKTAWEQSPPGYRLAVRRRNLLAARVPDYWRWKAACGNFSDDFAQADLNVIRDLSNRIAAVAQQQDSAAAADLETWAKSGDAQELFLRVTTEFSRDEVAPLCDRQASTGKKPPLDAATQFAIEQLLLTSLPNAADRDRLWKTLRESEFTPGEMTRPDQVVAAQARCEAMLVQFETELAASLNLIDADRLKDLANAVNAAAAGLGDGKNAASAIDFARQLGAYSELLAAAAPQTPNSPAAELFVRFADPLVPRAPSSVTLASLPNWKSPLKAIYPKTIELTEATEANVTLTLTGAAEGKKPSFQFKSIPNGLVIEHAGKPLQERVPLTADQFEFKITVDRNLISGEEALLTGEAWIAGKLEREPVAITVALPTDSQFELVSTGRTGLVKRQTAAGAPQLVLLAFPQKPTEFALAVKQNSGPDTTLTASLYALEQPPSNALLPTTLQELQSSARKLDVQVAVGAKSAKVSPLKFLPVAPPAPAAPAATTPPPAVASGGDIPLETKYLAIVLEESNAANGGAAIDHILWMAIEPLHPDRYVANPIPKPDFGTVRKRFQIPIRAKTSVEGDVAIPVEGVPVTLGGSEVFRDANRRNGEDTLTASHAIDASIDVPDEGADLFDARLFLDVGGYPRAFMWSVSDSGSITPFQGSRIAVDTPQRSGPDEPPLSRRPTDSIDVAFEVDSTDQDCAVKLQLLLFEDNGDEDDLEQLTLVEDEGTPVSTRNWNGARQIANYLKTVETGLLTVGCHVSDFTAKLSPGGSQGRGKILARIVDPSDSENSLDEDSIDIVIDGRPPLVRGLADGYEEPLDHIVDKELVVPVRVTDRLSGPASLLFWQEEPGMNAGVANPPGQKAKLDPRMSADGGFRDRIFTITLKELPPSPPAGVGAVQIFLLATDHAGNAMEEPQPFEVRYVTRSMDAAGPGKGKPRDVIVKVQYIRGTKPVDSSGAQVELVDTGEKKPAGAGGARFEQLPPGKHQFKATGNMANAPGAGELTVEVPETGEGPIARTITLSAVPPPPPPPKP